MAVDIEARGPEYRSGIVVILGALLRILAILGLLLYIPAIVAYYYGETHELIVFVETATLTLSGSLLLGLKLPPPRSLTVGEALFVSGLSWIVVSIIGGIPYVYTIKMTWIDAFFETMSGFTTTGMTLIKVIEGTPHSVLFWRAFTQWLGGAGIIMMFLVIIFASTRDVTLWSLYTAEARDVRIRASTLGTVKRIWYIYAFYTFLAIITLRVLGMGWFDSVAHSFTSLATGGFSTRTASIAAFNSPAIEMALAFFSFMGGLNFLAHYILFTKGLKNFLKYYEVRWALIFVAFSTALVTLALTIHLHENPILGLIHSIFQTISIMTTTGYTTADINLWPPLSKFVLLILMFIGGNMCSTGGAIKVGRVVIAMKTFVNQLKLLFLPSGAVKPIKTGDQILKTHEITRVMAFIMGYLAIVAISTILLTSFGYDAFQSLSAIASAQGNVGPCYMDLFTTNGVTRIILALLMWIGRLEVIPAVVLFMPSSWKHVIARKMR
jgi:trk system potassium uptake protein TrkH